MSGNLRQHGDLVVQVKPAWARCGSTSVFSSQLAWLEERGYRVVELFISPTSLAEKPGGAEWGQKVLDENPTFDHVVERRLLSPQPAGHRSKEATSLRHTLYSKDINGQFVNFHCSAFETYETPFALDETPAFVLCNHAFTMSHVRRLFPNVPVILETHDIQCLQMRRRGNLLYREVFANNLSFEAGWWSMADYLISLNPEENDFILEVSGKPGAYVPPPVQETQPDTRYDSLGALLAAEGDAPELGHLQDVDLLIIGDWHPLNVESVQWFLEVVLPRIQARRPTKVAVVGRVVERLEEGMEVPHVYKTGFLRELANIFDFAKVFVLPDQAGTGVSIKAREALSVNACFAATQVAMRGLDLPDVSWPEDAESLAEDILELLDSEEARDARREVGQRLREKLDWPTYVAAWDNAAGALEGCSDKTTQSA